MKKMKTFKNDNEIYNPKHKVYCVMRDSKGITIETFLINPKEETFRYNRKKGSKGEIYYTRNIENSSYFVVKRSFNRKEYYVPYNIDYSLPLCFKTEYMKKSDDGFTFELFPSTRLLTPIFLDQKARILNQDDMKSNIIGETLTGMIQSKIFWILIVLGIGVLIAIQEFGILGG